jgi:hypothetical protein
MKIELELTPKMVDQLRFLIDGLPMCTYAPLILAVLPKLPLENESESVATSAPDAAAAPNSLQGRGSFSLHALTPKGRERLPELERLLGRLPHTGDM